MINESKQNNHVEVSSLSSNYGERILDPIHFRFYSAKEEKQHLKQCHNRPLVYDLYKYESLLEEACDRRHTATNALIRRACVLLEDAEKQISEQQKRIQTLEHLASTDELTGLKNRRGFLESFSRELHRCKRGLSKGGLLTLIDLDNFKSINDTYGHPAGDACLRLIAKTLCIEIRKMDIAARIGGDEFVLLFPNTDKVNASQRAQQLLWKINKLSIAWQGNIIDINASLGLREYKPGDDFNTIFEEADKALYINKDTRTKVSHKDKECNEVD
jgi:diguanylate cyclase (GGDEF)-like protein